MNTEIRLDKLTLAEKKQLIEDLQREMETQTRVEELVDELKGTIQYKLDYLLKRTVSVGKKTEPFRNSADELMYEPVEGYSLWRKISQTKYDELDDEQKKHYRLYYEDITQEVDVSEDELDEYDKKTLRACRIVIGKLNELL